MKLSSKKRNSLPKKDFGMPGERKYPMPDKSHAANAKARASQAVKAGRMSSATKSKIDAKANKMLGEGTPADKRQDRGIKEGSKKDMAADAGRAARNKRLAKATL
jgi:hypothetical protein